MWFIVRYYASSSKSTRSAMRSATWLFDSFEKSSLLLNSVSRSNIVWMVHALTSVPSISTFAAAIPVGAAALQF